MLTWLRNRLWPAAENQRRPLESRRRGHAHAAMAYYAAFSLFPLCLVLIAAIGLLTQVDRARPSCTSGTCSSSWSRTSAPT